MANEWCTWESEQFDELDDLELYIDTLKFDLEETTDPDEIEAIEDKMLIAFKRHDELTK